MSLVETPGKNEACSSLPLLVKKKKVVKAAEKKSYIRQGRVIVGRSVGRCKLCWTVRASPIG